MSSAKTVPLPSREDVRTFLRSVDADSIAAAMQPKHIRGLVLPEDAEATKRVYDWLRQIEQGEWP